MDGWSIALLAVAGYLAVTSLVRLMIRRRDQLLDVFRRRIRVVDTLKHAQAEQPEAKQPTEQGKAA